ncbi:unnamed protein product [Sympodiomycopsis kandeliae]
MATLLGSLILLLANAHRTKANNVPVYVARRGALRDRSGSGSGPAWHEHPMWQHPALYEGAKLWPSSSSGSSSKSSPTHSSSSSSVEITGSRPAHSSSGSLVEITGSKPAHSSSSSSVEITGSRPAHSEVTSPLNKGKAVASGSGAGAPATGQSTQGGSFKNTASPWKIGRPLGRKDDGPRRPYKQRDPSTYKGGRKIGSKDKKPRKSAPDKTGKLRGPYKVKPKEQ